MLFITSLFFAALAAAVPQPPTLIPREVMTSMTVGEANDLCAAQQVHCCRDEAASENENHSNGLLAGVATGVLGGNGVSVLGVCSPLDVVVIPLNSLLHNHCTGKIACCQKATNVLTGGLINGALKCVAVGSLID